MRITLDSSTGTWQLSDLAELHLVLLKQAAEDASLGKTEEGRKRLHPRPLSEDESFLEEEFLTDWDELVSGELEETFGEDLKIFLQDLESATAQESEDAESGDSEHFHLTLPLEHGNHWFSSLNQARIMLDQKWKLHNENDEFVPHLPPAVLGDLDPQERFVAWVRYDFFCTIQEWIVRNVL